MNLKTVKVLLFTLFSLALASLIIGCGVSKPVYFLFTALFAIGYAAVYLLCWRCPFCGERLGRSDGEICPALRQKSACSPQPSGRLMYPAPVQHWKKRLQLPAIRTKLAQCAHTGQPPYVRIAPFVLHLQASGSSHVSFNPKTATTIPAAARAAAAYRNAVRPYCARICIVIENGLRLMCSN